MRTYCDIAVLYRHFVVLSLVSLFSCLPSHDLFASEFEIDTWVLTCGIGGPGPQDSANDGTSQVQNPLVHGFFAQLNGSTASLNVDMGWDPINGTGRFLLGSSITANSLSSFPSIFSVGSESRIFITPSSPLTVKVHAEYSYNLPVDHMRTIFSFGAGGQTTGTPAFVQAWSHDTSFGTGAGTFVIDGEFVLPPTETWQIRTSMLIQPFSGTQGVGSGSGFFDIQIVPEPTVLLLFFTGTLFALRLRSHAKHKSSQLNSPKTSCKLRAAQLLS